MIVTYKIQKGIHKERCDDSALIGSLVINDNYGSVEIQENTKIMIADGVGGNAGGDQASFFVMNAIKDISFEDSADLQSSLLLINDNLIKYAITVEGHELMATTVTGIMFYKDECILVHCGNTRIYALQGSFLKQITSDQTTYQWLMATGNDDAAAHCNKSEIRGAFGGGNTKFADSLVIGSVFERGVPSKVLLTSDGVHDTLDIDEIEDILSNDELSSVEKINLLIDSAVVKGSEDDCTAILIETEG